MRIRAAFKTTYKGGVQDFAQNLARFFLGLKASSLSRRAEQSLRANKSFRFAVNGSFGVIVSLLPSFLPWKFTMFIMSRLIHDDCFFMQQSSIAVQEAEPCIQMHDPDALVASANDPSIVDEELVAQWEDRLDMLGSEPDLAQLRLLLDEAPDTDHDLYDFAKTYYETHLPAAIQDWEDGLDSMGVWVELELLEDAMASCPDPDHPTALLLAGVITERILESTASSQANVVLRIR